MKTYARIKLERNFKKGFEKKLKEVLKITKASKYFPKELKNTSMLVEPTEEEQREKIQKALEVSTKIENLFGKNSIVNNT